MLTFRVCYVLSALVAVPLSFLRLFDPVESDGIRRSYDRNLYELADAGLAVDEIALVLLYLLVVLLLVAGLWAPLVWVAQPLIVALCVAAIVLLLVKPQTSDPKPPLSAGGTALLALACFGAVLALLDIAARLGGAGRRRAAG